MVLVHYNRSHQEAESSASDIKVAGGRCSLVRADLKRREDIESLISRCVAEHGPIDCLVNNAATFVKDDIGSVTWESFEPITDIELGVLTIAHHHQRGPCSSFSRDGCPEPCGQSIRQDRARRIGALCPAQPAR
jgi:NAD(P)-dependent dehydrogenase (short-subunit alcohol dehydrogenase family)